MARPPDLSVHNPRPSAQSADVTTIDPSIKEEQVRASITLTDGRTVETFVEHVVGSLERPMTDRDLEAKVLGLVDGVLPAPQAKTLIDRCWTIDTLASAADVAAAATPPRR